MNAKLLVPWLLADERPHDLGEMWPTDCPLATLQVTAKFSFVYSVPRGVFERLSCRCHQHSSYIRHWRSGLLTQYGCVKMLAHTNDNDQLVTMTARASDAGQNLYRLFHVLWRCVNEMEKVLVTLPGVLLDRYIMTKKGVLPATGQQKTTYSVAPNGPLFYVDRLSLIKKALETCPSPGIQTGLGHALYFVVAY